MGRVMKVVTSEEITRMFDNLINEKQSRESISDWAIEIMRKGDFNELQFEPPQNEDIIWDAIVYLQGADLLLEDGTYLHDTSNFKDYWEKIKKKLS